MMKSKITGGSTSFLFHAEVLGKYQVAYYRCDETGFIQTEAAYWLDEAYSDAITVLDIGLLGRNIAMREVTAGIVDGWFDRHAPFVDFGGGYGVFVRLMRDIGYDFYRVDPYCQNLFAKTFDWKIGTKKAELVTAWEVFEHLEDPFVAIENLLEFSDTVLFSTALLPAKKIESVDDWWYFIPETGQHISLHTIDSLRFIADAFGMKLYSDGVSLHILTRRDMRNPFLNPWRWKFWKLWSNSVFEKRRRARNSKLQIDFDSIREKLFRGIGSGTQR